MNLKLINFKDGTVSRFKFTGEVGKFKSTYSP